MGKAKRITVDEKGEIIGSGGSPFPDSLRIEDREGNILKEYKPYKPELDPWLPSSGLRAPPKRRSPYYFFIFFDLEVGYEVYE
jgi:hypothetical protein